MTIRRQYQLPNCSLILDGLSIDPAPGNEDVMSLLVNAECRISGLERSINGGYNFFAALVRAVSQYGQELLSGYAHPQVVEGEPLLVHINPGDGPYHHLVVQPEIADLGDAGDGRAIDIKLSAVQLFDLTEAVDQFFDDRQTLPELEPSLSPLARRFVRTEEPLSDRAIPAVLGVGGLVAATMALGLLPVPELRDPAADIRSQAEVAEVIETAESNAGGAEPPTGEATDPETPEVTTALTAEAEAEAAEAEKAAAAERDAAVAEAEAEAEAANAETDAAENAEAASQAEEAEDGEGTGDETFESFDEFNEGGSAQGGNAIATDFDTEPPATLRNFTEVQTLNSQLKRTIVDNREQPRFGSPISYRVRVNESGEITGYQPLDDPSENSLDETPLASIVAPSPREGEAVDYRVVFTERGVIEVSPYWGWSYYE